jgi:hypothetical protein
MITLTVLFFILKLFLVLNKLGAKGHDKNWNFCSPLVTPQIKLELILLNYLVVVVLIDDVYLIILWQVIE